MFENFLQVIAFFSIKLADQFDYFNLDGLNMTIYVTFRKKETVQCHGNYGIIGLNYFYQLSIFDCQSLNK